MEYDQDNNNYPCTSVIFKQWNEEAIDSSGGVNCGRIRGKDKPTFTPHTDGGDYVVVINAEKIKVTGSKFTNKKYYKHSLYPGGLKTQTFQELNKKNPERIIEEAVKGMLPKNKLGKSMIKKLKVFKGPNHDHESQQPTEWKLS